MTILVNGDQATFPPDATVASLVAGLTRAERGVAVALNGEVVPRSEWAGTGLSDGDRVEVLTAAQGG
ncbi:sulfur carrier protein ThiS [Actinoplanes sp. NPDC049265]|uniref:sulfur carrier protein ThiS n=1 Tax=Actinoplanes sp. NPDC049265 TaxID=3363902 RepID=UPI003710CA0A